MFKIRRLAVATASATILACGTAFAASGVYTAAQATQGASAYSSQCAVCHGGNLEGGAGPMLKGTQFQQMAAAQQLTAASLLAVITKLMPQTAPHSLSPAEYADITAYILQENGYPAGGSDLTADSATAASLKLSK